MRPIVETTEEARAHLANAVAALRDPQGYPAGEDAGEIDAIETHLSWVFLTERHAYKLKKPVRTPHVDYLHAEARRQACLNELRLNRRLAPDVYLDVVPLVATRSGLRLGHDGETGVVDWLLKMRRLRRELMLDAKLARGDAQVAALRELGRTLADFYRTAEPADWSGALYRRRLQEDLDDKRAALSEPHYEMPIEQLETIDGRQRRWLRDHRLLLEARAGRVVEAHGDLRPEHICMEADPKIIDCLDFDRQLRMLDPASELGFLALECRRLRIPEAGDRVLEGYATASHDDLPAGLVAFYQSYHAVIRAAVAVWHLDDHQLGHSAVWRVRARDYLRIATVIL